MSFKRGSTGGFWFNQKKAQTTIFIIIGIIIVVAIGIFFILQGGIRESGLSSEFEPVYNTLLSCIEQDTETGLNILGSQGGYIYLPDFEQGSKYMPFSSQLNFLGNPIPYWYYVSGNNIEKEQVPSKEDMEEDLERYIEENIKKCDYDSYYQQGYEIEQGNPKADVLIKDREVEVILDMDLGIAKSEDSVFVDEHSVLLDSNLGKLYDSAKKVYETEQETMFLENYGVDTLRLYAPVDGVEMTCSPKTWNAEEVFDELEEAIQMNTLALRNSKGEYTLSQKENEYFLVDLGVDENVRFINSPNWSNSFDVLPTEGNSPLMMATPVGNQPGLGMLGFCYVPYHFVYDIKYPVLIQVSEKGSSGNPGQEIFQFPFAVVIQGNKPREPQEGSVAVAGKEPEMCEYRNTLIRVNTYDTIMNPVDANISFECFDSFCDIGETRNGKITEEFPQCYNGFIIADAKGYEQARYSFSTIDEREIDIILDKTYEQEIELRLDGTRYNGEAIISFSSDDGGSKTIMYPSQNKIELSEGEYEIQVYVYKNSSVRLDDSDYEQCFDVPRSGIG
ncbi:MAG: hypothetical protein ACOC1P_06850, partial [Minisyncoccales bacterium]